MTRKGLLDLELRAKLFLEVIYIVDLFHAKLHLSDRSMVLFGPMSPNGDARAKDRYDEFDQGRMEDLLKNVVLYAKTFPEVERCRSYFENTQERVSYPEFLAQGLPTSIGVVEGGVSPAVDG